MSFSTLVWLAVLLPLLGVGVSFLAEVPRRSAQLCIAFSALAALVSAALVVYRLTHAATDPYESQLTFWTVTSIVNGTALDFHPQIALLLDNLSAIMLLLVTLTGLIVQVHCGGYLRSEPGYRTAQWQVSLLIFAVAGLVASANLFTVLVTWGVAGAAGYLLSAHWAERPGVGAASRRVFVLGRASDLALLLAAVIVYAKFADDVSIQPLRPGQDVVDPLGFRALEGEWHRAHAGLINGTGTRTLVAVALLVLIAAVIRAALMPFHTWLLDSSHAPAPIVGYFAAGAQVLGATALLLRLAPLIDEAPRILDVIAVVGAVSGVAGAIAALGSTDVVRIVLYGAVSQLGLILMGYAGGAYGNVAFALIVRGFAVLALALAVANLMSAFRTRDLDEMGDGWRLLPTTSRALLVAALAAGAVVPLGGFWAARAMLSAIINNQAFDGAHVNAGVQAGLLLASVVSLGLGALWPIRLLGRSCFRSLPRRRGFQVERVREVDPRMRRSLLLASGLAAVVGLIGIPGVRSVASYVFLLGPGARQDARAAALAIALVVPLVATAIGVALWIRDVPGAARAASGLRPLGRVGDTDFGLDHVYGFAAETLGVGAGHHLARVEHLLLDPMLDAVAWAGAAAAIPGSHRRHAIHPRLAAAVGGTALVAALLALGVSGHLPGVSR